jgi:protein gp37
MANTTTIEWTDATWNPVTGCTKISKGCDNCYAERFSERFRGTPGHPFEAGFDLTLRPARLNQPLSWREPRMIFVNSMSDLFHKEIPTSFISQVCDTMERAHWHTFQVLTKRSSLMRNFLRRRYCDGRGPSHIWSGASVEDGTKKATGSGLQLDRSSVPKPLLFQLEILSGRGRQSGNHIDEGWETSS